MTKENEGVTIPSTLVDVANALRLGATNYRFAIDKSPQVPLVLVAREEEDLHPYDKFDSLNIKEQLERQGFKPITKRLMDEAVMLVASERLV